MRFLVALLTVLGGALSLFAAVIIVARSIKARQREHAIAAMNDEFSRLTKEHDTAYEQLDQSIHASDAAPVLPFRGIDMNEHADQVQSWYRATYKELLGYEPGERPPAEELGTRDALVAELSGPAVLAAVGVVISTGASVWSLYLQ